MTRVLLANTGAHARRILGDWIGAERALVARAANIREALDHIQAGGAPAVAFCDQALELLDGAWLAEHLRHICPQTAVVVTTTAHDLESAVRGLRSGVVDYLAAPFTRRRVTDAFDRAHHAHEARTALSSARREADDWRSRFTEAVAQLELSATASLEALLAARRPGAAALDRARRVARVAVSLALALEIREPEISDIERAVLLRDPARRPGADERQTLAILGNVPMLSGAIALALAADDRGAAIPIGAQIIGVASAYDELVSGLRGAPVTPGAAVQALCRQRPGGFEPRVLDALRMLQPSVLPD